MSASDAWYQRYQANQKVPYLPSDDPDLDCAVNDLQLAVGELREHVPYGIVTDVVRLLRHRRDLAALVLIGKAPTCLNCGGDKKCPGCDDIRPKAENLAEGWQIMSPLDRWEMVTRVEQANEYAPVRVWTDKTGPNYSWLIPHHRRVDAAAPPVRFHGTPEIRIVEYGYSRDAPMYAIPTLDTTYNPEPISGPLAEARYQRGEGWTVTHRPDGGGEPVVVTGLSKAKARTVLRSAAGQHAKALGVKVRLPARGGTNA